MKTSEFRKYLEDHPEHELRFILPDGDTVPVHAHITEVGRVDKKFVDCGGTMRRNSACLLQAWTAEDTEHRLLPGKLARVMKLAEPIFEGDDLDVEIEYEDCAISQFPAIGVELENGVLAFRLAAKHTDCLAKEACTPQTAGVATSAGCCS